MTETESVWSLWTQLCPGPSYAEWDDEWAVFKEGSSKKDDPALFWLSCQSWSYLSLSVTNPNWFTLLCITPFWLMGNFMGSQIPHFPFMKCGCYWLTLQWNYHHRPQWCLVNLWHTLQWHIRCLRPSFAFDLQGLQNVAKDLEKHLGLNEIWHTGRWSGWNHRKGQLPHHGRFTMCQALLWLDFKILLQGWSW